MKNLSDAAHELETKVIAAVNEAGLPAAFVEYILRNILMQVEKAEKEGETNGNSEPGD